MYNNKTLGIRDLQYEAPALKAVELAALSVLCDSKRYNNTIDDLDSEDYGEY